MTFMVGVFCSTLAGYAGMWISVRANLRVAQAAMSDYNRSVQIAFYGGYFVAVINMTLAILGISYLYLFLWATMGWQITCQCLRTKKIPALLVAFGFGASFVSMFSQFCGGMYPVAVDVGVDLIGKIDSEIPEDQLRMAVVNAHENVAESGVQAVNFFESICAQLITAMILGSLVAEKSGINSAHSTYLVMLPLALGCLDIISSTIGMWNVNTKPGMPTTPHGMQNPLNIMIDALRSAFLVGL